MHKELDEMTDEERTAALKQAYDIAEMKEDERRLNILIEQKETEEFANDILNSGSGLRLCDCIYIANNLYKLGYRKSNASR